MKTTLVLFALLALGGCTSRYNAQKAFDAFASECFSNSVTYTILGTGPERTFTMVCKVAQ